MFDTSSAIQWHVTACFEQVAPAACVVSAAVWHKWGMPDAAGQLPASKVAVLAWSVMCMLTLRSQLSS
jgi:hypothetical protein